MATLTEDISATQRHIRVTGGELAPRGLRFRVDDELMDLVDFDLFPVADDGVRPKGQDRTRWFVSRGVGESEAATHSAGDTLKAAVTASTNSENLIPPAPFFEGDGGEGGTQEVYVQADDPGAVGAGKLWVQTVPGAPGGLRLQMWVWGLNHLDAEAWLPVGAADGVPGVVANDPGLTLYDPDADYVSLMDVALSSSDEGGGARLGRLHIDNMHSDGTQRVDLQLGTDLNLRVKDAAETDQAVLEMTGAGDAELTGAVKVELTSDNLPQANNNPIVTNPPIAAPAAFVANGATTDELRDALIAAGLMEPAP